MTAYMPACMAACTTAYMVARFAGGELPLLWGGAQQSHAWAHGHRQGRQRRRLLRRQLCPLLLHLQLHEVDCIQGGLLAACRQSGIALRLTWRPGQWPSCRRADGGVQVRVLALA